MNWFIPEHFEKKKLNLMQRMQIIKAIRGFFDDQDFLEVETPILQTCPVMDAHIHAFKTELLGLDRRHSKDLYLQTSPEFDMKKLLSAGLPKIYQICHVFRNAEGSKLHSPEFTMIEWYRARSDYLDIMDDCVALLRHIARHLELKSYSGCDPFKDWQRLSVCNAVQEYADLNIEDHLNNRDSFASSASAKGIRVIESDGWDDIFHAVMAEKVEPNLGFDVPTILYDYPLCMAALSRKKPDDNRYAERFELYVNGIELANAFSELTDATEQRERFKQEMQTKQRIYGEVYPADEEFFKALEHGMPESSGIALGVDRLVMLAVGAKNIKDILWTAA